MSRLVAVSGGFDPLHVGHIEYLQSAAELGQELIVIVNTDAWLMQKKGYLFMPYEDRRRILLAIKDVVGVVEAQEDRDGSIAPSILALRPTIFAKGGDRTAENLPSAEMAACAAVGCRIAYGVGGGKIRSSQQLVRMIEDRFRTKPQPSV